MNINYKKSIIAGLTMLSLAIIAGGARYDRAGAPPEPAVELNSEAFDLLEQHIPFRVEKLRGFGPEDSAVDMDVIVQRDEQGRDLDYTWRARDGEALLVECDDFYDLYYRCDGPSRFNVRVITRDYAGKEKTTSVGLIAVN